jgi:uncharacterized membrane protein YdbT with pleckstrin-like domain
MASYIERSLGAGEKVVARARFPWPYILGAWAALIVPLLAAAVLLPMAQKDDAPGLGVLALVVVLAGAAVFLKMMIRKWTTEIGVTSHRFVEKYGLVTLRTNEIALHNIEGVRVTQGIFGKLLGYGTVRIEGTGVDSVTTPPIADPVGFVRAVQTARELEKNT